MADGPLAITIGVTIHLKDLRPKESPKTALILIDNPLPKKKLRYYPFTLCLFALGLRPSEAIGLRWRYVDLERKQVTIAEAIVRIDGEQPLRKGTKNGVIRQLDLVDSVAQLLAKHRSQDAQPEDLVFTTPNGRLINLSNYRHHCWKQAIEQSNIPYRPPYAARHTFISWGLEQEGWSLPQAAALAGNSVGVMADTYAHMVDRPAMPKIDML